MRSTYSGGGPVLLPAPRQTARNVSCNTSSTSAADSNDRNRAASHGACRVNSARNAVSSPAATAAISASSSIASLLHPTANRFIARTRFSGAARRRAGHPDDDEGETHPQVRPDPAFGLLKLYDDALPHVYGYLLARCGNTGLAEELTSESFLAAVHAVRKPDAPDPSIPWLIGVARHKLADHWRRVEREQRGLRLLDSEQARGEEPWETVVDRIRAREVLGRLGAHHRAALTLRYLDGLPVPEVARHLDRTLHATEALLVRARAAFRRIYEGEEGSR